MSSNLRSSVPDPKPLALASLLTIFFCRCTLDQEN